MKTYKWFAILLSVLLMLAYLPLTSISISAAQSGTTGNCKWTLDDNGHLTISGYGKMDNYEHQKNANGDLAVNHPWGRNVTSVTVKDGVSSIGERAFYYCKSLEWITIPSSVNTIGYGAFLGCDSLTNITVDEKNSSFCSIDGVLFNKDKTTLIRCPAAKNTAYIIPNSVTAIDAYAFYGCESIPSVIMPDSVTTIGDYAFAHCDSLKTLSIPDSVKTIRKWAFCECLALSSVSIGNGVETIEEYAFVFCDAITDVYYESEQNRYTMEIGKDGNNNLTEALWHYKYVPSTTTDLTTTTSSTHKPTIFTTTTTIKNPHIPQSEKSDDNSNNITMAVVSFIAFLLIITTIILVFVLTKKRKSK